MRSATRKLLTDKIDRALAQFERGEYFTAEESKRDMAERKARRLTERQGGSASL